jgi:uncharacterized protein YndB with AHSA1/START domain
MSVPTKGSARIEVAAPPERVYDLIADVTRMGEWSPECRSCEWQGPAGQVGSRFKGKNRSGPLRWTTTAEVLAADRPREFTFATMFRGSPATKWSYRLEDKDGGTVLTESFDALHTPAALALIERLFVRNRQEQLEAGMADTIAKIKTAAEAS